MEPLLTNEEMRAADAFAISCGIPELVLMEHAALAIVTALEDRFPGLLIATSGLVLAGPGNNGGDVLAAVRMLWLKGCRNIRVALLGEGTSLSCKAQLRMLESLGVPFLTEWSAKDECDWVLDGMFGIGLSKPIEGRARAWIERLDLMPTRPWVISADIPSGLNSDSGVPDGVCVHASQVVTFGFMKRGLVTGNAANHIGELRLDPIQIPAQAITRDQVGAFLFERGDCLMPKRIPAGHKGLYGHAKFWCGEKSGASLIAASAAIRTGVGLVTIVGRAPQIEAIQPKVPPDVMTRVWESSEGATSIAIGSGLGTGTEEKQILMEMCLLSIPLVLDADAITIIGNHSEEFRLVLAARRSPTVFTPHPKEAARLLPDHDIERDRYGAAARIADLFGVPVLLKGKGTLIAIPGRPIWVVLEGDSALSRGGTGDLLTGIVNGLMAQKMVARDALALASYFSGEASCRLVQSRGTSVSITVGEITGALAEVIDEYASQFTTP